MSVRNVGLGKGLDSLIPISDNRDKDQAQKSKSNDKSSSDEQKYLLDVNLIKPNPHQPRKKFDDNDLRELSDSIKEHGVIQPLIVTKEGSDFVLIAGERRLRATKLAGIKEVPVIYRDTSDIQKVEVSLIENIQRSDLNVLEEAAAYKKLIDEFSLNQDQVAKKVGKARSTIANALRLLELPVEVKQGLREGKITEGHARAILSMPNVEQQLALYNEIVSGKLNVRQTEAKVKGGDGFQRSVSEVDPETKRISDELSNALGAKVLIQKKGKGGKISIEYYSDEELSRIYEKLV